MYGKAGELPDQIAMLGEDRDWIVDVVKADDICAIRVKLADNDGGGAYRRRCSFGHNPARVPMALSSPKSLAARPTVERSGLDGAIVTTPDCWPRHQLNIDPEPGFGDVP